MDYNALLNNKNLSKMMRQYIEIKQNNEDCILFYRVGDFYELFFEDAIIGSKVLELVLTGKDCGLENRAEMCGIPYHAIENYLQKMVSSGYKVAICEQVEDPSLTNDIVKREVIKIVTPGTLLNSNINDKNNNYIISIYYDTNGYGVAILDYSIGDFLVTNVKKDKTIIDLFERYRPKEVLFNNLISLSNLNINFLSDKFGFYLNIQDNSYYDNEIIIKNNFLNKLLTEMPEYNDIKNTNVSYSIICIYKYIIDNQKIEPIHIEKINYLKDNEYMYLDLSTIRNLELVETMINKEKVGSLLNVLDSTKTSMGARLLKYYVLNPLNNIEDIKDRQLAIKDIIENNIYINELNDYLNNIYDLERILTRILLKTANAKDLLNFKKSISSLPYIKTIIKNFNSPIFNNINNKFDDLNDIYTLIDNSINEDAPFSLHDGDLIKSGYSEEIDKLRTAKDNGKSWLLKLEEEEKEKNNIKNMKIKYSKLFGYLFEITNTYKGPIPDYFIRKQTLANAERYTTKELDELQSMILNSQDRLSVVEFETFQNILNTIIDNTSRIKHTANIISIIDVFNSLASVALKKNYVCPNMNENGEINIIEGRHPVVESLNINDDFIPNNTNLNNKNFIDIITGPNMAGKSTYMRQVALIVLLSHIGSYVPATSANICLVDRIFTRVGASDDLSRGQSTFMVEMNELSNILNNATSKSLIILDEIGRGTSTYDGLSIAWAVVEYLSSRIKAKTLFATHYHELTELEGKVNSVTNYNILVSENNNNITFLRKIVKGSANKSYGIAVAKLAGVNDVVINRATEILNELNEGDITKTLDNINLDNNTNKEAKINIDNNKKLAKYDIIEKFIKTLDIMHLTPIEALNILSNIKEKINEKD